MNMRIIACGAGLVLFAAGLTAQQATLTLRQALESTLGLHPELGIRRQEVVKREGVRREITGTFDRLYQSGLQQRYTPIPISVPGSTYNSGVNFTAIDFSASRLSRSGVSMGPSIGLSRTRDNLFNPDGISQARVAYEVTVPLRRNPGQLASASEISAAIDVRASRFDVSQTGSALLASTAVRYWELTGALQLLQVAVGSEQRGRTFLDTTRELIAADRIPRNDINLVNANLAGRAANRIDAQQDVTAARQALAFAMGLAPEGMLIALDPAEDLPETELTPDAANARRYVDLALMQRADYRAAAQRVESARSLRPAAQNQTRPSIDLVFSSGYSGLNAGAAPTSFPASLFRGVSGADVVAGVRYQFAPANNTARGRLEQVEASIRQTELLATNLARTIAADVTVAVQGVRNAALRLQSARESVAAFQEALKAEREKYTLGFGSLVDILTTEDRLTQALAIQVRARVEYAVELARLRLATGTIVSPDEDPAAVDAARFRTLPEIFRR